MAINQNDIIYFLITDRFYGVADNSRTDIDRSDPRAWHGGNFEGIIEKIPYLLKLGITAVWITPVYLQVPSLMDAGGKLSASAYHGYWPLDFNAVDPHLYIDNGRFTEGSKLYVKELADALHRNGIKLILDMVVNHTGYGHPALTNDPLNPTPIRNNWYNRRGLSSMVDEIQGELAALPDMDLDKPDVCDYHIETILSWIRSTGIDGIRMDTVKHVERVFWNFFKTQVKGMFPDVTLIGEVLVFDADAISQYQQHFAFDSLFDFPMQEAMNNAFIYNGSLKAFVSPFDGGSGILEKDNHYTNHNKLATLLDNHDLSARFMSLAMQQCGNNRTIAAKLLKLALTFMFTIRGIPQIYYGTETAMEGFADPDNRRDLNWKLFDPEYNVKPEFAIEKDIFDHSCALTRMRKNNAVFYCGNFVCLYVDDFILAFLRYIDDGAAITVIHNGSLPMPETMSIHAATNAMIPARILKLLEGRSSVCPFTGHSIDIRNGSFTVRMKEKSAAVFIF